MPVFNHGRSFSHASGATPYGPGNYYGVGTGKYGAPTKIPSSPPLTTPEDRLNDMHLSCDQWLAMPLDQQRYTVYLQSRNANPNFEIGDADPIVRTITGRCNHIRLEQGATMFKASGDIFSAKIVRSSGEVVDITKPVAAVALLAVFVAGGVIGYRSMHPRRSR